MWNKSKKIISLVAAATFLGAAFTMTACDEGSYKGDKLDYTSSAVKAESNGGFVVEKDGYVYFINGAEDYTASNKYGEVTKGALMRIAKSELDAGNYSSVQTVVPMLFVAQNFNAGIYIYGDYVYYATPTTDKNMSGQVENSWIDFKSAKLDGSEAMKGYYFRLSNNAANYRFVEVDNVVYCLYEENSALKSYNTETGKTSVLVSGAKSSFYFDTKDLTNANVYYTMSVVDGADTDHPTTAAYDQLYCVNAAAVIEGKADAKTASYTVKGGKTYDFKEDFLKEKNKEAKDNKQDEPYDLSDYTTYPYVNLGDLVLDGIGLNAKNAGKVTQFSDLKEETPATPDGYNYTISSYQNGGIYFTRTEVTKTSSDGENTKLYYLADADVAAEGWNTVDGNGSDKLDVVALNTTNASSSAIFTVDENGAHTYFYFSNNTLYKAGQPDENGVVEKIALAYNVSGGTLWTINGDYLYYYGTGTNGNNVSRINYTGDAEAYNPLLVEEEYEPLTIAYVDWNSSWYKPEIVNNTLIYSNAQSFGSVSYNYIYATKLGTTEELKANNEAYEEVNEFIDTYSGDTDLQKLMKYYFRTGETQAYENVKDLYSEDYQVKEFDAFVAAVGEGTYKLEKAFISQLGALKAADKEAIEQSWVDSLLSEEEAEDKAALPGWAVALIIVGSVLVVAAAVAVPLLVVNANKRKAAQAEADAIVNAHKKKIDTTDDKSIDVYAEEEKAEEVAEEATEEATEAPVEEVVEEVVEEPVEETVEEAAPVVEEAPAETPVEEAVEAPAEEAKTEE